MFKTAGLYITGLCGIVLFFCLPECTGRNETVTEKPESDKYNDYGDIYFKENIRILKEMWDNEQEHIGRISTRIADTIRSGGKAVWDANAGHFAIHDTNPEFPCLPEDGMISCAQWQGNRDVIASLGKGDVLVTNFIREDIDNANERGVYVIGVICNYFRNKKYGTDILKPNWNNLLLDDISDEVFDTHMPEEMGLVRLPWCLEMKAGPGTGTFSAVVYWLIVSEVANKMVKGPDAPPLEYAPKYIDILFNRLEQFYEGQRGTLRSAASQVAERIKHGSQVWVKSEPLGVWCTASGQSAGLFFTNPDNVYKTAKKYGMPEPEMEKDDVIFIADVTDNSDSKMVQLAREAKDTGMFIITSCPSTQKALRELADISFDNYSPEGYGLFEMEGHENRIAMVGSVINNVIYNTFAMQMAHEMKRRDMYPKVLQNYMWPTRDDTYRSWIHWAVGKVGH